MFNKVSIVGKQCHPAQVRPGALQFPPRQLVVNGTLSRKTMYCRLMAQTTCETKQRMQKQTRTETRSDSSTAVIIPAAYLPQRHNSQRLSADNAANAKSSPYGSSRTALNMATSVRQSLQELLQANQRSGEYSESAVKQLQSMIEQQQQLVMLLTEAAREGLEATAAAVPADTAKIEDAPASGDVAEADTCTNQQHSSGRGCSSSLHSDTEGKASNFVKLSEMSAPAVPAPSNSSSTATSSCSTAAPELLKGCCSKSAVGSIQQQLTAPQVFIAVAADKGHKKAMQDFHSLASICSHHGVKASAAGSIDLSSSSSSAFGAVFDGHGGHQTAAHTASNFANLLHKELCCQAKLQSSSTPLHTALDGNLVQQAKAAMHSAFLKQDRLLEDSYEAEKSGSTAVVALVNRRNLVVANAGDSVAVLARGGGCQRLSAMHNPYNQAEAARVVAAGGVVGVPSGKPGGALRVMKDRSKLSAAERYVAQPALAVTRAFGDFRLKSQSCPIITAVPHVEQVELSDADKLLLLTSDGITDVLSDDSMMEVALAAVEQASNRTADGQQLAQAAAAAVKATALQAGAWDNLTVVAMLLDWNAAWSSSSCSFS